MQKSPRDPGYPFNAWTLDRLREHLAHQTRVILSPAHLSNLMHQNGVVYRRPKHGMSHLRDPQEYNGKKALLAFLKKGATRPDPRFDLLYPDECEVHLHPTLTKVWTLRGVRPVVPAAGVNQRLCIYGAMNDRSGRSHYLVHAKKNARQFREFLRQLLEANSERRLVLVIDNASSHRTRPVLTPLDDHSDHVMVLWLPRYSPEPNRIEGLWGYLKRSALNNYFFGGLARLERAVHETFTNPQQHPETTRSLAYRHATN